MELKYVQHLASFHPLFQENGSNVLEIEDCGHLSMIEKPEIVAAIILKLLQYYQSQCPEN
jgi:pimeloyl-ACP methyl ester carboxylesterase